MRTEPSPPATPVRARSAGSSVDEPGNELIDDGTDLYDGSAPPEHVPGGGPNIWALHPFAVEATNAAWDGKPAAIIWHLQLEAV